jgi:hypothetical protein
LTPERTLKFKRKNFVGGKLAKDRVTLLVYVNAERTEKRKFFMIGKPKKKKMI